MSKITKDDKRLAQQRAKLMIRLRYKPNFCELLVEHMSKGLSFETFHVNGVFAGRSTLDTWVSAYPEFREAKEMGISASKLKFEKEGLEGMWSEKDGPRLNHQLWIAHMKNRFGWTDRVETNQNINGQINHSTLMDYIEGKDVKEIEAEFEDEDEEDEDGGFVR